MLLLTNSPHNKEYRPSPRRHMPLRGCSEATVGRIFANEDAMQRLISEFENLEDVSSLRKCNRQVRRGKREGRSPGKREGRSPGTDKNSARLC